MSKLLLYLILGASAHAAETTELSTDVDTLSRRLQQSGDCKFGDVEAYCDCPCSQCTYCGDYETVCRADLPCGFEGNVNICCAERDFRNDVGSDSRVCDRGRSTDNTIYENPPPCKDSKNFYFFDGDAPRYCNNRNGRKGVEDDPKKLCKVTGYIGANTKANEFKASDACPVACSQCADARDNYCSSLNPPKTVISEKKLDFKTNWAYWDGNNVYDCSDVAKNPFVLCSVVGVGGVTGSDACGKACDVKGWESTKKATVVQLLENEDDKDCGISKEVVMVDNDACYDRTQALVKFDLKKYSGQAVEEATLLIYTEDEGQEAYGYRMGETWDRKTKWGDLGSGGVSGATRSSTPSFTKKRNSGEGYKAYDVTSDVGAWLSGVSNDGWGLVLKDSCCEWYFYSDKAAQGPILWMKLKGKGTAPKAPKPDKPEKSPSGDVKVKRKKCKSGAGDRPLSKWSYDAGSKGMVGCANVGADGPESTAKRCARIGTGGLPAADACCETCAPYTCTKFGGAGTKPCKKSKGSSSGGGGSCADSKKDNKKWFYKGLKCKEAAAKGFCGKKGKDKKKKKKFGTGYEECCKSCKDA